MPTKEMIQKYGLYKNDQRICQNCGEIFFIQKWNSQKFCSWQCGINYNKGRTYGQKKCLNCGKIFKREKWKIKKQKFCSFLCGIDFNRGKVRVRPHKCSNKAKKYYPERRLKDGRRIALHRYLMEQKIGRQLKSSEHIHHIDMDKQNNNPDCSNFYLYLNASEHQKGHHSLEKLVKGLLKDKIIRFKNGKYLR